MKKIEEMSYNDMLRNSKLYGEYKGNPKDLKMIGSWPDVTFWVDKDGNIWEEYVPTFD